MIAARFRGLLQSAEARQAVFAEAQASKRVAEGQRAHDDLVGAIEALKGTPGPVASSAAALYALAAIQVERNEDGARPPQWIANAVRDAQAVRLAAGGAR